MSKIAAAAPVGMDKPELRKHIVLARRSPVHISFAMGGDGKAVVVMDKRKPGRSIEKDLKAQAPDAKNHRFGTLSVDPDQPDVARLVVNCACEGMARKLVLALKGTGVRQLEIMLEDGSPVESALGEDEAEQGLAWGAEEDSDILGDGRDATDFDQTGSALASTDGADDGATMAANAAAPVGIIADEFDVEPTVQEGAQPVEEDAESLSLELAAVVKRMIGVLAVDPSQQATLARMATDARADIKRDDVVQARADINALTQAVAMCEMTAGTSTTQAAHAAPAKDAVQRYQKCRVVWLATRSKIDADIRKLSAAITSVDVDGVFGDDLEQNFLNAVEPVLATLDGSLADTLGQAAEATDPDAAAHLLDSARATIDAYKEFVADCDVIAQLDQNPFLPMAIAKTLTASLSALSASIH